MNHYALRHKMAGLDGNPTPSLAGPPGSVRKSHLWLDFAKELGIGIASGVITTALTALLWKFVISKLINYCVGVHIEGEPEIPYEGPVDCDNKGEPAIPDAAPPPNPTPADFVGVHIEGEPEIPYRPVDCDNKGEPAIPDAALPPNPTPADFVGVHIEGEPEIPYEAPVDCDNKGEPAIPDAAPPPNPTPADFVGVHIEGEPEIPYEAPVDCDNKGEPAIPDAAPPLNPPLSLLTLWRSFTVVLTNNFIARLNKRATAEPAAPLEIDREPSIV